jgi:thiamine biosynthesis lipoprotein
MEFRALGTDVFLEMVLDGSGEKEKTEASSDLLEAKNIFFEKEKIFSRFDQNSEISKLNKNLSVWLSASLDIRYLSERALRYNEKSGGLYDPRIIAVLEKIGYERDFRGTDFSKLELPDEFEKISEKLEKDLKIRDGEVFFGRRMDFSGIAKGYIVDQAAEFLKKKGWKNFLVDAGGDMGISGLNNEGEKWKISIEGVPEKKMMLEISDRGIATSGISRKKWTIAGKKFHHLVNPKNPNEYSYELRTVSVIAKNTESADGRAKTLVLMGKEKGMDFARKNNVAAIFLDCEGDILVSPEARQYLKKE